MWACIDRKYVLGLELGDLGFRYSVLSEFRAQLTVSGDFTHPDRVVRGATRREDAQAVAELYRPLKCPILITDPRTAEMIKYASNAGTATFNRA